MYNQDFTDSIAKYSTISNTCHLKLIELCNVSQVKLHWSLIVGNTFSETEVILGLTT